MIALNGVEDRVYIDGQLASAYTLLPLVARSGRYPLSRLFPE